MDEDVTPCRNHGDGTPLHKGACCDMKEDEPPYDDPDFIRDNFKTQELCGASYPKQPGRDLADGEAYGFTHILEDSADRQR